jgi:subtilase family serine protease
MQRFSTRRLFLLAPFALCALAQAQTKLPGSIPAWANAKNHVAAANPSDNIGFRVYLTWNNSAAVEALAQAVSNPANFSYKAYLTPAQFRQQFAPSQAQVNAVQSWLRSQGFTVEYTPQNNHYVSVEGTVARPQPHSPRASRCTVSKA